jgi:hypothetical protein
MSFKMNICCFVKYRLNFHRSLLVWVGSYLQETSLSSVWQEDKEMERLDYRLTRGLMREFPGGRRRSW